MQSVTENIDPKPLLRTERTCVGCRRVGAREEFVRVCIAGEPAIVAPDLAGKLGGRGAWLCPRLACVQAAVRKGGLSRAARRKVDVDPAQLAAMLREHLSQRMRGLLLSAHRARRVAVGTDAVMGALEIREAKLLVSAHDAAGRRNDLEATARRLEIMSIQFDTKEGLGRMFGRAELGVIAVLDAGIADELARAAKRVAALSEDE
jgi:predicted RNA-binding protein YlxR (DUF448 family)/ribosomal protein L30E